MLAYCTCSAVFFKCKKKYIKNIKKYFNYFKSNGQDRLNNLVSDDHTLTQ